MKSILVTKIELEKPAAHVICSFMDSGGKASGPIKRCLFIGYIIIRFSVYVWANFVSIRLSEFLASFT